MIDERWVILGSIIATIGGLSYLIDTIRGHVKPNRVSFFLWALAPLIAFAAEIKEGVGIQSLTTFVAGLIPLSIFIASILNKKAEWKLIKFDLACGGLSLVGLILWYITKSGNIAIIFSILADGLAALPTLIKSYNFPETESAWPYFSTVISATITLLTVKVWNLANIGFPIYLFIVCFAIFVLVQFKVGEKLRLRYIESSPRKSS